MSFLIIKDCILSGILCLIDDYQIVILLYHHIVAWCGYSTRNTFAVENTKKKRRKKNRTGSQNTVEDVSVYVGALNKDGGC